MTRAGVEAQEAGDRVAHRVEPGRPGAAGRPRSCRSTAAGRQPAAAGRRRPRPQERRAGDAARRAGSPAGKRRPRSPRPAAPSRRVGDGVEGRRRRRNGRAAAGAPAIATPPRASGRRPARTDGCPVPRPIRGGRRGAPDRAAASARSQVVGHGHLEVGRLAGDGMDRDSTGLQQGGLVGVLRGAGRAGTVAAAPLAAGRSRTPWGVWAVARPARSTVPTTAPPSTRLSVSATGSDRDGRAVLARPPRRPRSAELGRDERPGAVVDEDDRPAVRRRRGPAPTPAATDSWRRGPPATTRRPVARQPRPRRRSRRRAPAPRRRRSGRRTGAAAARRLERPRPAAAARRAARGACRGRPSAGSRRRRRRRRRRIAGVAARRRRRQLEPRAGRRPSGRPPSGARG